MDSELLRKLQVVEYEILCMIDDFCNKHDIRYSLYAGTALGAVRHGGFIPWDDDIDLAMTRSEFDRFCKAWKTNPVEGYYLESILTDDYCGTCHAKVRKNGTVLLSDGEIESQGHHGIWVDIFPLDKISLDKRVRSTKKKVGRIMVLLTRANVNNLHDTLPKKIVRGLFRLVPHSVRIKQMQALHSYLVNHTEDCVAAGYNWKSLSTMTSFDAVTYPADLCNEYITILFAGRAFPIFKLYDYMLKEEFGDYMKLPPEDERECTHNPVKIVLG